MHDAPLVVEAVLTDLDGVLVDSTTAVEQVWRQWAERVGVDVDRLVANLHGVRSEDTVAGLVPAERIDVEVAALEAAELEHADEARLVPGADTAGATVIAVATSHPREELAGAHLVVADPGRIGVTAIPEGLRIDAR